MRMRKKILAIVSVWVLGTSVAGAQGTSGWLVGQAGLTTGRTAVSVSGEAGARVNGALGIYGSFGHIADATPALERQAVDAVARQNGIDLTVKTPTHFGIGGVKVFAGRGRLKPYALGGLGFARIAPRYTSLDVDVTDQIEAITGAETTQAGRVVEFGGGVEVSGPLLVDVGYRVLRLGPGYNVSRFYAGAGLGF